MKKGVIVIGGHVQGLGITRIYGKSNIPVILLDKTNINLTKHSKFCKQFFNYKDKGLLNTLLDLAKLTDYKDWLLMPTNDAHVEIISENKKLLSKYYKVSSEDSSILEFFFNKRKTYKLAEKLEISIPKTNTPDSLEELDELKISYPCIIKPAVMHTFYSQTKKKVFVCNNIDELKENYKKAILLIPNNEVIIQDIIPGNSEHQYSVCVMYDGEKPLVTMSARRARQHPPDFGNATTYAETVYIDEIISNALKILKEVKYKGVCEVEFKFDVRDGKYKFLEVNPRTWKWHSISEKTNSPFLISLYNFIYNLEPIISNDYSQATFRHLATDIPTQIKMFFKGIKYAKSKKNTKFAVWDKKDLLPAFFEILYLPYLIIKR